VIAPKPSGVGLFSAVLALVSLAAAAADARGAASPAGAAATRINWNACGPRLQCARVPVPLDWARPGGQKIRLAVIRYRASRRQQRIGSMFYNPGGPGVSGVDALRQVGESLEALGQGRFDVVSWDIRGSGRSAPVRCFRSARARARFWAGRPVPSTRREKRRYLAKTVAFARRCGSVSGRKLLAHVTTADTARDLDHLRRLVGDRRLTFYGQSAGTMIGQTYANLFARRVRAMALDSVIDPVAYVKRTAAWLASSMGRVDATFGAFLSLCQRAGPDRCPLAGTVPAEQRARQLLAQLRRAPLAAPTATPPGKLTYGELLTALKFTYLPAPSTWHQLGSDLAAAVGGDASALVTTARMSAAEPFHEALEPMQAIVCADSPAGRDANAWPRTVDRLTRVSRIGGPSFGWLIGAPCASWPVRNTDRYTGPWNASTRNPILLVGGPFDPNTPLAGARHAALLLANTVLLTYDGYGHISTSDPSACIDEALSRYLVDLDTPRRGTVCRSDRLPFDPDFGQPLPQG
jgi:pimeloyl-ACP methyl ester carboxylesterase